MTNGAGNIAAAAASLPVHLAAAQSGEAVDQRQAGAQRLHICTAQQLAGCLIRLQPLENLLFVVCQGISLRLRFHG